MEIPITQSEDWAKLQEDLKEVSFLKAGKDYQYLAILKKTPVGNYLYCPYGPIADNDKSFREALDSLTQLGREQHAVFIRIEPRDPNFAEDPPRHAKKSKDLSPKDTWLLDLTPDVPDLISHFSQGTRTRYNTYAKKGLTVETTTNPDDIQHLVDLQNKLFRQKNLSAYGADYLKAELEQPFATLYLVKYNQANDQTRQSANSAGNYPADGQVLAASLFFDHNGTRYYMQSAADTEYRRLPATVALLTKAIFDAKEQGIKRFDFWGIAPDDAPDTHPWKGFTEFKKSFGGYPVHYAGTYDLILNPTKYKLYRSTRKLSRLIRKK